MNFQTSLLGIKNYKSLMVQKFVLKALIYQFSEFLKLFHSTGYFGQPLQNNHKLGTIRHS